MSAPEKIGLYGKGTTDAAKCRVDAKKSLELASKNFSKVKPYNCAIQPKPQTK